MASKCYNDSQCVCDIVSDVFWSNIVAMVMETFFFFDAALKPCSYYQVMGAMHDSILIPISGPTPDP